MNIDDFDEEDLEDLTEDHPSLDSLSPEEIIQVATVDKVRKVRITAEIRDEDGNVTPLHEIIEELLGYIKRKIESDDTNNFKEQIAPLMNQTLASGLPRLIGIGPACFYITNESARVSISIMMSLSLLLLKYIQEQKLTIFTVEEPLTDEEMESLQKRSDASSIATMGYAMGMTHKQIMETLLENDMVTREDLEDMLNIRKDKDKD